MPITSLFSGSYCNEKEVASKLVEQTGYRLVRDEDVIAAASARSGMSAAKVHKAFSGKASVFNTFTHEKERSLAYLRLAMAELLSGAGLLVAGFSGLLIPKRMNHVLRVCLIADLKFRSAAARQEGVPEKETVRTLHKLDEDAAQWVHTVAGVSDPWSPSLYDIVIPMNKMTVAQACELVVGNLKKEILAPTAASQQARGDFLLEAAVEVALAKEGHHVAAAAENGSVTLTINKQVLMLGRLEEELQSIAGQVPGVRSITTKVGKGFHQADIYRKFNFELPSKVLLVDDEREFVQTLSERLLMREMGSAVAYDGESALAMINENEDEPEVMILDLKMPGIDGIEVLKRVKQTRPEIEVLILTGHGSEEDRETCLRLGAFAYLRKPVDIDVLTETLRRANEKMRQNLAAKARS
jgi:two-component system, OmpR family, response regulator CpxR